MVADNTLQQNALNEHEFTEHLDAAVEMMVKRPNQAMMQLDQFFHDISTTSIEFKSSDWGSVLSLPQERDDEADAPVSSPAAGRSKTFTNIKYVLATSITERFLAAQRWGKAAMMAAGLPVAIDHLHELARASIFDDAFAGATYTGSDGVALCSNSHVPENPLGPAQDNLISGSLTPDTWHEMRVLARQMTDERGLPLPHFIRTLLVGPTNERAAEEQKVSATTTKYQPDTVNRTPTVLTTWDYVVSDYIDDTNSPWFGFTDQTGEEKGLYFLYLNGMKKLIEDAKPSGNSRIKWRKEAKTDFTVGIQRAWQYVFGSSGTA